MKSMEDIANAIVARIVVYILRWLFYRRVAPVVTETSLIAIENRVAFGTEEFRLTPSVSFFTLYGIEHASQQRVLSPHSGPFTVISLLHIYDLRQLPCATIASI